eukprot:EG_transcript_13153
MDDLEALVDWAALAGDDLRREHERLAEEVRALNEAQRAPMVSLHVRGDKFRTTKAVLTADPESVFSALFSHAPDSQTEESGAINVDSDPAQFGHILQYMRGASMDTLELVPDQAGLLQEVRSLRLKSLLTYFQAVRRPWRFDRVSPALCLEGSTGVVANFTGAYQHGQSGTAWVTGVQRLAVRLITDCPSLIIGVCPQHALTTTGAFTSNPMDWVLWMFLLPGALTTLHGWSRSLGANLSMEGSTVELIVDVDGGTLSVVGNGCNFGIVYNEPEGLPIPLYPAFFSLADGCAFQLLHSTNP